MKIEVENLGILKKAEFELGELTLICGGNNTGKTYATYALFGFLSHWRRHLKAGVHDSTIQELLRDGVTRLDVESYTKEAKHILRKGCEEFTRQLPGIFASKPGRFNDTKFQVSIEAEKISSMEDRAFRRTVRSAEDDLISLSKAGEGSEVVVSLLIEKRRSLFPASMIKEVISDGIVELLFEPFFPQPFIASTERTGAAIFRKELNFARNRLLEEMSRADGDINPMELMSRSYQDYPLPVNDNVDFIGQLGDVAKRDSYLVENHPHILDDFADIIGGEYIAGSNDTIYFRPSRKQTKLTMDESSSAVRSLLDIGFYLRHVAKPGDLLMVDEPELNLHPENQRRIARLFARLVNLGIRVFVTTHSDYIVKELNTLIMLNQDKPYLKTIAQREGYNCEELLSAGKIRVYVAQKALMNLEGRRRRSRHASLVPASIDPDLGIEVSSFDETINKMNEIQDAIVWGGDE
ncbi:MAG: ATP-binding protein [Gemmatimonadota bacterium]|nr:ATP-binding protein [Gemmatimonadota bacterium]